MQKFISERVKILVNSCIIEVDDRGKKKKVVYKFSLIKSNQTIVRVNDKKNMN